MILASSMKSSSDMDPSLIILMATSCWPCHLPYLTTPNWPFPSSLMKVRLRGSISQIPGSRSKGHTPLTVGPNRLLIELAMPLIVLPWSCILLYCISRIHPNTTLKSSYDFLPFFLHVNIPKKQQQYVSLIHSMTPFHD